MASCCSKKCFHCKGQLPQTPIRVDVSDTTLLTCSEQCAETTRNIAHAGLMSFYEHRSEPATTSDERQRPVTSWESFERPAVMRQFVRDAGNEEKIADLLIQGVHCAACTWLIENSLGRRAGVRSIEVNPVTTRAALRWNPAQIGLAELLEEIARLGYTPVPFTEQAIHAATDKDARLALRRLLLAGLGMMEVSGYAVAMYAGAFQGMDPSIHEFFRLISMLVATPVVLYSGAPFFAGCWRAMKSRRMTMDVPVGLAIAAAYFASVWNTFTGSGEVYFDSATMFVFFLSGTRYLEAAGRHRAFDLTHALAQHIPSTTVRLRDTGREEVGVLELEQGDVVLVPKGSAFPADGILLDSGAEIDESMLTGESIPVLRQSGDTVAAGTLNAGCNALRVSVDRIGSDTVLAQIGRLVMQASNERPELLQLTDRVASVFVSAVLLIAVVTAIVWWQLDPAQTFPIILSVLVVTCPCALALATPAALTVATTVLARRGFLIRRGQALDALAKVNHMVFDKTGTLTENALQIERTVAGKDIGAEAALNIAAALEASSAHPIARAFRSQANITPAHELQHIPGGGLEGRVDGQIFRIGTAEFAGALNAAHGNELRVSNPNIRTIYLGSQAGLLARFEIAEKLRVGTPALLHHLQALGIQSTIASGDHPAVVRALANRIGASDCHGGMLPEQKLALVQELQSRGEIVAAVGDGINDSPVLAGANVSIAMGNGTSIAQHSADCIWLGNQLSGMESAFLMARRTMGVVRQNIVWALVYNLTAIPLAVGGLLDPWMAALGMSLSSLLVMLNALRLGIPAANEEHENNAAHAHNTELPVEIAT